LNEKIKMRYIEKKIKIQQDLYETLKKLARDKGIKLYQVIKKIFSEYLKKRKERIKFYEQENETEKNLG